MVNQELKITFQDGQGNRLGTLLVTPTQEYHGSPEKFPEEIGDVKVEFANVPRISQLDNSTPILFNINKELETFENILLMEETEYQLVFAPEKSNVTTISFPTLEKTDKNSVFTKINFNRKDIYGGILNFKSYAGKSFFDVKIDGEVSSKCPFEVRSRKIDYINHYSAMIGDLAQAASSLIFNEKSPLYQPLEFQERVKKSFYEDFMFLEYIFRPENLNSAYGYIKMDPHRILVKYQENVPLSMASSVGTSSLIDMVSNPENLIKTDELPPNWPSQMREYVPQEITQQNYTDSLDTPENRFIKYFLTLLHELINEMVIFLEKNKNKGYPAQKILKFKETIQGYIMDGWLDDVGKLNHFPSNSQVLQKKEGYREIFDYFLIFEFSFNSFEEIKDEIKGYQKKLSDLYEYWCYLKIIAILSKMAGKENDYSSIFDLDKNWSIRVKRSKESTQKFLIPVDERYIEVELEFNREFKESDLNYKLYPIGYRPDYTLKINNGSNPFFLHFDAKYKLNQKSSSIISDGSYKKSKIETYKNEDIFKMHTYKDAIKHSAGAYVLYPGEVKGIYCEGDGLVPSIGAFPLTPGKNTVHEENDLERFIFDVLQSEI